MTARLAAEVRLGDWVEDSSGVRRRVEAIEADELEVHGERRRQITLRDVADDCLILDAAARVDVYQGARP